jgi:hypothetical protein
MTGERRWQSRVIPPGSKIIFSSLTALKDIELPLAGRTDSKGEVLQEDVSYVGLMAEKHGQTCVIHHCLRGPAKDGLEE